VKINNPVRGRVVISAEHERALIAAILNADGPVARSELRALLPQGLRHYAGLTPGDVVWAIRGASADIGAQVLALAS
jgi:hypothetical protein